MKFAKYFILGVNILMVGIIVLCYLAPMISPSRNPYLPAFGILYPFMFMIHVGFVVFWFFVKKKYTLISILTLLLGFSAFGKMMSFGSEVNKANTGNIFKVSSYNIAQLQLLNNSGKEDFYKNMEGIIDEEVCFFQEMSGVIYEKMKKRYRKAHFAYFPKKSTLIVSPYPIINKGNLNISSSTNSCIYADMKINNQLVRFYNAHLQSNSITNLVNKVKINSSLNDEKNWNKVGAILKRYSQATKIRLEQIALIKKHASNCTIPYVLGGDMNDVPQSYAYSKISNGLIDGFRKRGFGLGTTFAGRIPTLRIDYIFGSSGLRFLSYDTDRMRFSDHFRISARLEIEK